MPESLRQLSLEEYLERLASSAPAPGGGAVVALIGAEAAALLAMALRVTDAEDNQQQGEALDQRRLSLLNLAEADAAAFSTVMAAYKLPANDDESKARRRQAIQDAFKTATEVPLQAMKEIAALYAEADTVTAKVKPAVASDVGVAIQLIDAALKASRYNLWVNLKYIRDESYKLTIEEQAKVLLADSKAQRRRLHKQIRAMLV